MMRRALPVLAATVAALVLACSPARADLMHPRVIAPAAAGGNVNASLDTDGNAATVQQTVPGVWITNVPVFSGNSAVLTRRDQLGTNAGQRAVIAIASVSPSILEASVTYNAKHHDYLLTPVLRAGEKRGTVTIVALAPAATVDGITYEAVNAATVFRVKSWP
jgi:hypothetical protein